jgi:uncharacterized protein YjiS (DUF1127 family)
VEHVLRQHDRQFNQYPRRNVSFFPAFGWSWKIPVAWLIAIAVWWDRRDQYRQLLELDDRLLADIGLSRTDVEEVRRSPLYLDAWRDSR